MPRQASSPSPLDRIPPPDQIRDRLSEVFAEVRLLRRLLRLSESKSRLPGRGAPLSQPRSGNRTP